MRFWDASAVVPLLMDERWSDELRNLLVVDRASAVWWGTRVECVSAVRRRERQGEVSAASAGESLRLLDQFEGEWVELQPSEAIRAAAERLLAVHPLRAADALQLAAANAWRDGLGRRPPFVCFDERLRDAAAREGFEVLPRDLEG